MFNTAFKGITTLSRNALFYGGICKWYYAKVEDVVEEPKDEMAEEAAIEMAEKLFIVSHLKGKKSLSEKETKFIADVEAVKLSESNQKKVNAKLEALKGK
jgi:hypothetical protein